MCSTCSSYSKHTNHTYSRSYSNGSTYTYS
ncbi:MAG: hypothetical protein E7174_01625 [Firmicutes bacterium]|nr:hypothetical protein [Bacillota bacterium]